MDRGSTPSRKEKDGPTRTSADISVPRLRPAFPEHLITRPHLPCYFTFCFTLVPSVFYTPVTRRTALYYIPTAGRRAEPPPARPSGLFTLTARRRRPSSARRGWKPTCQPPTRGTCMLQRGTLFWSVHSYPPSWKPLQPRRAAARPTSAIATRWHAVPAATQRQCATPSILPVNSIGHNAALTSVIRCADGSAVLSVQTARAR